jgi:lipopolysaccharide heptosyltransferase I
MNFLKPIILVDLKLPPGWKGVAVEKWSRLNFEPENLTQNPDKVFKSDNGSSTILKKIGENSFVVKKTDADTGLKALANLIRAPKSLKNFHLAVLLGQKNIEVAAPVAALWHKTRGNIYITEYIPGSLDLYDVAFGKEAKILEDFSARKAVIQQTARIIAKLHKADFWHRDAKAGNFIVYNNGGDYKVKLIDLDGIKQNPKRRSENRIRTLAKLAETLIRFKTVNFTDLYRGFRIYCDEMTITGPDIKRLFQKLERVAVAARLATVISDSYKHIGKILIIKPSALGDIVLAMPAACRLAESFPDAEIHWFVRPEYSALLENHPAVHKTVIFARKKLGKWWYKPAAFAELVRLVKQLRNEKYDIVFDFQGRFRSAIFAFFSGCKQRIGIADTQEITSLFYTKKIRQTSAHLVDYFLDMTDAIGAKKSKVEFGLSPRPKSIEEMRKILSENQAHKDNYAVFIPAAAVETKRWPAENFAALAQKIYEKYKCSIVAVGVESEKSIVENLQKITDAPVINLAGKTNIPQLIALLASAKIVVGNDTGPTHIAAALGAPLVLIFGHTNPSRVGPYSRGQTVAAIDADSRGLKVESDNPAHDIKNVSVEKVFEKINRQLEQLRKI